MQVRTAAPRPSILGRSIDLTYKRETAGQRGRSTWLRNAELRARRNRPERGGRSLWDNGNGGDLRGRPAHVLLLLGPVLGAPEEPAGGERIAVTANEGDVGGDR